MEARTLHTSEIRALYDFVRSKYVRYIDVQHEIVDHLASSIEDEMEKNPSLDFKTALNLVYSRFPITGFAQFVQEQERAMNKYWWRQIRKYYLQYFTLPKCILTLCVFYLHYLILSHVPYGIVVLILAHIFFAIYSYKRFKENMAYNLSDVGKYLVIYSFHSIANIGYGSLLIGICSNPQIFSFSSIGASSIQIIVFSLMFTINFIVKHAQYSEFPQLIQADLEGRYAHLELHSN